MKKLYYSVKRDSFIDYITVYDNELKVFAELESLKYPDTGERFMSDIDEIENYLADNGYGDEEFDIISIENNLIIMKNIIENNKLIAEFLNWEFDDLSETFETPFLKLVDPHAFGDEQFSCKLQDFELEFHSDWNWLMQVVEKIESLGYNIDTMKVNITKYQSSQFCGIYIDGKIIYTNYCETKIEAVYNACLEFIKWYNK